MQDNVKNAKTWKYEKEMVQMLIAIDKIWEIVREKTLGRISKGM